MGAEQTVRLDSGTSITTVPSGTQAVSGTISTYNITNPNAIGSNNFSISAVPGVVAANNFISLFNPVGSGVNLMFNGAFISCSSTANNGAGVPLRGLRITAASGGTLQTNSTAIAKFKSSDATSVAEIRIGNPTVTLGAPIFNSPPAVGTNQTTPVHAMVPPPAAGPYTLVPGEGIVLRTESGLTSQVWNMSIVWSEF